MIQVVQDIVDQEVLGLTHIKLEEVEVAMEEMEDMDGVDVKVEKGVDFM